MTTKTAFSQEEWEKIRLAPSLAASGVTVADPSGIFSAIKEAGAAVGTFMGAMKSQNTVELFSAMAADKSFPAMPDQKEYAGEGNREQQLENIKATILAKLQEASRIVASKATPDEAQAYRQLLMDVAQRTAEASKEGGFLGFGGVRVSSAEESFIQQVQQAISPA